jgi:hypothetical protein
VTGAASKQPSTRFADLSRLHPTPFVHIWVRRNGPHGEKSVWQDRKCEKQQQRQQQRQQRKRRRQDVRNTLLIIPFVAGSVLTCIDCVNLWFVSVLGHFFLSLVACKGSVSIRKLLLENACQVWPSLEKNWEDGGIFFLIWGVHVQTISVFSLPPVA